MARLAASESAADFVLKCGVLMAAFAERHPTQDIDFAVRGIANDVPEVEQRVRSMLSVPRDDGLEFDADSVSGEQVRDDADCSGVRVKMTAQLATAQVALHLDTNFGDPIWTAPTETALPLLLGGTLGLLGYPDHMVLAEKIVTALERGEQNTGWRDLTDIAAIARSRSINGDKLRQAIDVVALHRHISVEALMPLLTRMPGLAQRKREVWCRRQRLEASTSANCFKPALLSQNRCSKPKRHIRTGTVVPNPGDLSNFGTATRHCLMQRRILSGRKKVVPDPTTSDLIVPEISLMEVGPRWA